MELKLLDEKSKTPKTGIVYSFFRLCRAVVFGCGILFITIIIATSLLTRDVSTPTTSKPSRKTVTQKKQIEKVQTKPIPQRTSRSPKSSPQAQTSYTTRQVQPAKWYAGGTLINAKMKEWSQASYNNKLATAADLVMGCLKIDGVDVMKIDIERELKPMAIDFAKGLDNANADGLADNMNVSEVAATMWVIMQSGN